MESQRNFLDKTRIETAIWVSKLVLLVVGAISTATVFKVAVIPYFLNLALSTVPEIWISFKNGWASPLYIYLAVNSIIAAIALTSTFGHKTLRRHHSVEAHKSGDNNASTFSELIRIDSLLLSSPEKLEAGEEEEEEEEEKEEESWPESDGGGKEEPPGSGSGEESSMEETWRAIEAAKRGSLKRSETMAVERVTILDGEDIEAKEWARKEMRKSETFNDRAATRRREERNRPMSTEELSRRAEAFIKKVNDDMRLQRLHSHQRFVEMVNRGL